MPSEEQKYLVQLAADHGAHLVIGHHPHVLQPIEWIEGKNGNHMLAVYSLGNFFYLVKTGCISKLVVSLNVKLAKHLGRTKE